MALLTGGISAFVSWYLADPLFTPAIMAEIGATAGIQAGGILGSVTGLISLAFDSTLWDNLKTLHKLASDNMDDAVQLNAILSTLSHQNSHAIELREHSLTV